jgi:hypothetical protein
LSVDNARKLLPESDVDYLVAKRWSFDVAQVGGEIHLDLHKFQLPPVYTPDTVTLRIVLPAGYPNGSPDMFWTLPWVKLRSTGADPLNASYPQPFPDATWQRWSRHFDPEKWRAGIDGLRTYLGSIRQELDLKR